MMPPTRPDSSSLDLVTVMSAVCARASTNEGRDKTMLARMTKAAGINRPRRDGLGQRKEDNLIDRPVSEPAAAPQKRRPSHVITTANCYYGRAAGSVSQRGAF